MKKILVATDYSKTANNALDYASNLAKNMKAELILFNVHKMSIHASNSLASTSSIDNLVKKSEDKLIELAKKIEASYNIKVSWKLGKDDTVDSLKDYTNTTSIDLVVMGIESNLTEYKLFGNTTTSAIKLMQFPLLVVPNDISFNGINKIMYACDTSYLKENCNLTVLKDFVNQFNAELNVFHVFTDGNKKEKNEELELLMDEILKDVNHTYNYINSIRVGDGIVEGLKQFPADLLVMIPHKLGFFESIFKGSNTNQMTVKTRVPLLVIPNESAC